jgi:hypothetical protein
MDKVFGYRCLQNEIVWAYRTQGATKRRFSRKHDTILFYVSVSQCNETQMMKWVRRGEVGESRLPWWRNGFPRCFRRVLVMVWEVGG